MTSRSIVDKIAAPDAGIIKNLPPHLINARGWSDGLNVQFRDGYVKTSPGWQKYTSHLFANPVAGMEQFFLLDGTNYLLAITTRGAFYFDTGTNAWVEITDTAFTVDINELVSFDTWPNLFLFTNNKDRPRKWDGTGNIAPIGGLSTAEGIGGTVDVSAGRTICVFSGFTHLCNTIEDGTRYPQRWRWSRYLQSEQWNNTGTYGQAGYADITDGPDHLLCVKRLGNDYMALYKEHSIHIAQYVGPPTIWARRLVTSNVGLRATGAVADLGDEHILLGDDNFYVFNGLAMKAIGTAIFQTFLDELNPAKVDLVKAFVSEEDKEVWFIYPTSGNDTPNRMVCYNYENGAWSFRDAPFTCLAKYRESTNQDWDAMADTWEDHPEKWDSRLWAANNPIILCGQNSGYVQKMGADVWGQDGSTHDSYVISPAIDARKPDVVKRWLRIFLDAVKRTAYNLEVSLAVVDNVHDTPVFGSAKTYSLDLSGKRYIDVDVAGVWLYIKFRTNHTERPWSISGYGTERIDRGRI